MDKEHQVDTSVAQINDMKLDRECVQLPSDYVKYAVLAAEAKRDVDEIKNSLEVLEAELAQAIRAEPKEYGLEKITEAGIGSVILVDEKYQKRLARLRAAEHNARLAQAVVGALDHKKRSLTLLVELWGMGYFSSPKVSARGKEAITNMTMRRLRTRDDD